MYTLLPMDDLSPHDTIGERAIEGDICSWCSHLDLRYLLSAVVVDPVAYYQIPLIVIEFVKLYESLDVLRALGTATFQGVPREHTSLHPHGMQDRVNRVPPQRPSLVLIEDRRCRAVREVVEAPPA